VQFAKVLNSKDYGVPQNRERIFLFSIRADGLEYMEGKIQYNWPKPFPLERRLKDVLEDKVDEKYYLSDKMLEYFTRVNEDTSHGHDFKPTDGEGERLCNKNSVRPESGRQLCQGRVNSSQDGVVVSPEGIAPCHSAGHSNQPKVIE
jgi:DNA (cytosine-5)-methyltransferase 1